MTGVRSFDVFDTVLTRAVGSPSAALFLVGRRAVAEGWLECSAATFLDARLEAERRVYLAAAERGDQVRLADVYAELRGVLDLTVERAEAIHQQELALEARVLEPVPGAREWVAAERARADRVAFVSDTPVPEAFLREQLLRHGFLDRDDLLLVSSECGSNKADGAIYRELARRAGVPAGDILHQGNHQRNDVAAAERAGIGARARTAGNLNRYEESLDRDARQTEGLSAALAGASRLARLQVEARTPAERAVRDVTAGVVARCWPAT